jgi:hypothetical protein
MIRPTQAQHLYEEAWLEGPSERKPTYYQIEGKEREVTATISAAGAKMSQAINL